MNLATIPRSGRYYRVADPTWVDPSDTTFSRRRGARWNVRDRFGALYLNRSIATARANARRHVRLVFGPHIVLEDLVESARPDLQLYEIAPADFLDIVSESGIAANGLDPSYPDAIPSEACGAIAERAYEEPAIAGIAARSAADQDEGEDLAIFDREVDRLAARGDRVRFADWF